MVNNEEILKRMQQNNARGEELVKFIQQELPSIQKAATKAKTEKLAIEIKEKNQQLKKDLEFWKNRVIELEVMTGLKQYPLPSDTNKVNITAKEPIQNAPVKVNSESSSNATSNSGVKQDQPKKEANLEKKEAAVAKKEKGPKSSKPEKQPASEEKDINVSRLDLRIGRILNAKKHPDAESLYVEEIDVGEDKPRTVVSGLVKFVPLEEMQNRLVVVLCNLKPAKMRGVTSEAMVMCASTPDKVEILTPPPNAVPGDRVVCDEYPGEPDTLLPPKKKIFEQVAPDLKTDGDCNATYKSALLKVADKGVVKSTTLTNVQIK
ncbi:aminoacyl tRNA synthase complex-interacting multifunctional protein 1 [Trichonephila clavata]|uniref:Aminoacyl tRNA synthase complex-interacting multifunctional protein 1 n=1 Tax=Trichonephila clavata TaxID=2740835 RepID=A0A8X6K9M1_TRICU|nr:aminoacyl tRNA synthase complex-interacting multifunctional protein 1 [Trichonephila clavata]